MTTETEVTRFVPAKDVVTHFKTLETASNESDDYKFQRAGNGHFVCKHGDNAYAIIEKRSPYGVSVIGCSCKAWTFAHDKDGCKHVAAFQKRSRAPAAALSSRVKLDLLAAGWRETKDGNVYPLSEDKLTEDAAERQADIDAAMDAKWNKDRPETATSDPGGEGSEPVPPEADKPEPEPELGEKVWTRKCPHCDEIFEGTDLDTVKREHQDHIDTCSHNPKNTDTMKPEPVPKVKPASRMITTTCERCGEVLKHEDAAGLQKMIGAHEAICPKRPEEPEQEATVEPQPEEKPKMAEEETKTYPHPDGTVFETAEALLDYADHLTAIQTTTSARRRVQHKAMIKGISPQLQEVGRIAVGEKGGLSKSGKTRLPTKLDHFIFTTLNKDDDDRYIRDTSMMEMFGENCTEIPIRLLYNDIELNFPTFYAKYARSGIKLRGDGENWTVYNADGTREEVFDPNNERGFLDDPDIKPHGILTVLVEGQNSVGGAFKFRTTSWNSINNILSSLSVIKNMCGMLTYIPLKLVYRRKEVTPKGMGHKTWIPVVSVEFRGSIEELQAQASEVRQYMTEGQREETKQIDAAVREHLIEDESIETQQDIADEFSPGVV